MDEPKATPMARSILSFTATNTAVMCSQALPAMGSTIKPRNSSLMPLDFATSSKAPVKNLQTGVALRSQWTHVQARQRGKAFSLVAQQA